MIFTVALLPPHVAVIVELPNPLAVTTPSFTVATLVSLLFHVIVVSVALSGFILALILMLLLSEFKYIISLVLSKLIEVTGFSFLVTVIFTVSLLPSHEAVIVVLPTLLAVTTPSNTVATFGLLLFHVIFLFVELSGETVVVNFNVLTEELI